jgi:hypothetical protein
VSSCQALLSQHCSLSLPLTLPGKVSGLHAEITRFASDTTILLMQVKGVTQRVRMSCAFQSVVLLCFTVEFHHGIPYSETQLCSITDVLQAIEKLEGHQAVSNLSHSWKEGHAVCRLQPNRRSRLWCGRERAARAAHQVKDIALHHRVSPSARSLGTGAAGPVSGAQRA